jgi:hypothetical protein
VLVVVTVFWVGLAVGWLCYWGRERERERERGKEREGRKKRYSKVSNCVRSKVRIQTGL